MKALETETKTWLGLRGVALGVTVILAGVPAWLVVQERWLHHPITNEWVKNMWYARGFNRWFPFPEYFLLIFGCAVLLVILGVLMHRPTTELLAGDEKRAEPDEERAGVSRRQKVAAGILGGVCGGVFPFLALSMVGEGLTGYGYVIFCALFVGTWVLWEVPLGSVRQWLKVNGEFWGSILLAHAAVVGWIVSVYTPLIPFWLATVTVLLTHLNLYRFRQRIRPVFWVVSLALLLSTLFINAWWYSVVGDEFAFYDNALWLSSTWREATKFLYYGNFVYGKHPFGSTILQAIFMTFFGQGSFGWRFSNLYFTAIALVFYEDFWRRFLSPRIALWSVVFLAGSHYLMNFGKIGYNNLQGFLAIALVLWTSGWAVQSKRRIGCLLPEAVHGASRARVCNGPRVRSPRI
ncbi:MAG TPA: glycosyltransferase family 39 protein [Anaerolineales bacterium]|nr:glycosyltransferase family 39 protein [Anaerolineales bacterium]